ncbi:saccharopine dehydrogenase NADP-binding domain-containing protein [Methylobacterium sp. J-001]|uniref:saccharopine dehydrogenase family protein n=1 Tax=Methylobacterium sp. J-001 TaxID=2836609 RepID=UPI001FB913E2|nr:saccharopine dehydrogenase NADP-binding domain-containing protein [Methylobacterium sp. J-001]MCJ2117298.1 saccharopine dehydrogenase NADP-binding domain-containing protein [Methylobacterium sp. J-001]
MSRSARQTGRATVGPGRTVFDERPSEAAPADAYARHGTGPAMTAILIYGATGYTGTLLAEHARTQGLHPVLAGRDPDKLRPLAARLGLDWRAAPLDDPGRLRAMLAGIAAVIHAAGPFSKTAQPMAEACLAAGAHYVDITGEIDVLESLAARDADAKAAGIVLLPAAGFDVVPSDCLAAHVANRLPGATHLRISIGGFGGFSRGTARTMVEGIAWGTRIRRDGHIVELPSPPRGSADFGRGARRTVGLGWGDVSSAWYSTRVPNIEVYFEAFPAMAAAAGLPAGLRRIIAGGTAQRLINRGIDRLPPGPSETARATARSTFLAEAWDGSGHRAASRMETPEGYTLTVLTALETARRVASGAVPAGFHTPVTAFGPDFILGFPNVVRTDL